MRSMLSTLVAMLLCTSAISSPAAGATYTFTNVADNTGPYSGFKVGVAINNAGKVAFRAYLDAGASRVHAIASHLVLPGSSLDSTRSSGVFASILGTDSHPGSQKLADKHPWGAVSSIVGLFVEALDRAR